MGLSDKIIGVLVTAGTLTLWTLAGGFDWYGNFLSEQGIQIGEVETLFSGYVLVFLSSLFITYLLLWGVQRRRHSEV